MLPVSLTAKAIQLCAAGFGGVMNPPTEAYAITVHTGPALSREPVNAADAEATVRDLITLSADFNAGPLEIAGRDFATYGVTSATVFDACALAHVDDRQSPVNSMGAVSVSNVSALVRRAFGARIPCARLGSPPRCEGTRAMGCVRNRGMARSSRRWFMIGRLMRKTGGCTGALALCTAGVITVASPGPAYASDWGCQVVLCLATPGSPTKYAECVPPITKLWNALAMGGGFPSCTGVGIKTKSAKHGYTMTVTQTDGTTSRYSLDTRYQTVTQQ